MKNASTIFVIALAAISLTCACTSPTEGLDAATPGTTQLSIECAPATRTAIGGTSTNGYMHHWQTGDCISINGTTSEAAISSTDARRATFEVAAEVKHPYALLHPASTSGRVAFPASQSYYEGTFDPAALLMYGYVEEGNSGTLNHLCSILRFRFTGSATLSKMVITAAEGALTGEYTIDCRTGVLSEAASTAQSVEYLFDKGLALSADKDAAKPVFVALPAGEYGECNITLHDNNGGSMRLRFNTADRPLRAGVVREFQSVEYSEGASATLTPLETEEGELIVPDDFTETIPEVDAEGWMLLDSRHDLRWLSYHEPIIDGVSYSKIRVVADIDAADNTYAAMRVLDGTEIDGGNKRISNLHVGRGATSLFGNAAHLNLHNLTLENMSVISEENLPTGAIIGTATGNLNICDVTLRNCHIVAPYKVGGVVGALESGDHSFTHVTIEGGSVETLFESGTSGAAAAFVGYAGSATAATQTELTARFTNCSATCEIKAHKEATDRPSARMIGVVAGYSNSEKLYFTECDASGVTLTALDGTEPFVSRYTEEHRAEFCTPLAVRNSGFIGDELYCRAEIYFDNNRFAPQWDGSRSITPLKGANNEILIYSPADLASQQGKSLTGTMLFKSDIDLGGHKFKPINYVRTLDGEEHSLYNLKVVRTHDAANNRGAAFIIYASGQTVHKNLTFVGADILCEHDATIPNPAYGMTDDNGAGNAYAGTLVSRSWRSAITDTDGNTTGYTTYTILNVHARNGKVRGVCKVGGLVGALRGHVTMDNCSVDSYQVENYTPNVPNYYLMKKSKDGVFLYGDLVFEGLQWWYTHGECGGLIGFAECHSADITNCSVTNTNLDCVGQPNKEVVANIWKKASYVEGAFTSGASITGGAKTTVAGRHVNQFIGDIRSRRTEAQAEAGTGEYTFNILDYTVSGNTYGGVAAESTNDYNHNYASGKYCDVVGCAYYVGVDIKVIVNIHVSECAGTLTFRPKGGEEVTLTEAVGSGSNLSWFGGASSGVSLTGYTSYYPAAPTE